MISEDLSSYIPEVKTTVVSRDRARAMIYPDCNYSDAWAPGFAHARIESAAAEMDAHDLEVARAERRAWADYIENWGATVGSPTLSASRLVALLREDERPFGAASADSEAGS